MWVSLALLSLLSCSDDTLYVVDMDPEVSILAPIDGQAFDEGTTVDFVGKVNDDNPLEDLVVEWASSINGILPDTDAPDDEGNVEFSTASLLVGTHIVTLRATAENGVQAEDQVTVDIIEVPEAPSIEVVHPTNDEKGMEGMPFVFMATVDDRQDLPENLEVSLASDPGGFVCYLEPDGHGNSQCAASLPIATYLLTFTVEDSDGNVANAMVTFQVVSPDDYDFDGDGFSVNGGDCNDSNDTIYPGAPEICDGMDNDCSEATGIDVGSECYDDDGDGYCEVPPCMNTANTEVDCDDTSTSVSPGGDEVLNGVDDDCDGFTDEGTNNYDDDGDGFCESPPCLNAAGTEPDCDDGDFGIYPEAIEICGDGIDNNCDGLTNEKDGIGCKEFYFDADGDTYGIAGRTECWCDSGSYPYTGVNTTDCYDDNANAYPGQRSYFTAHRGDGSYDYDCSYSEEKQYLDVSGGCDWDVVYLDCECNGEGWATRVPACGGSDLWIDTCNATYDPVCYALCLLSHDPISCLLYTCGATCDPEYDSLSQGCR